MKEFHSKIKQALSLINQVIIGKEKEIELAISCLFAGGHLLLEDMPGTGKTTLALVISKVLGCSFARIQFTSDLLPSDILGGMVYHPKEGVFFFRPGPVFHHIILADEINRANPKTQSALLEAMEEIQVSVEGTTRVLPRPFFVIATQNPLEIHGTYPLPESQLDRFLMRISLGYPTFEDEIEIVKKGDIQKKAKNISSLFSPEDIIKIQDIVESIRIHSDLVKYAVSVVQNTRKAKEFLYGLSTRALQGWIKVSRAHALIQQRDYVIPEDLKKTFMYISFHRLIPKEYIDVDARHHLINAIIDSISIPQ